MSRALAYYLCVPTCVLGWWLSRLTMPPARVELETSHGSNHNLESKPEPQPKLAPVAAAALPAQDGAKDANGIAAWERMQILLKKPGTRGDRYADILQELQALSAEGVGQAARASRWEMMMAYWAEVDVLGARQWMVEMRGKERLGVDLMLRVWVESDPDGLLKWLEDLPEEKLWGLAEISANVLFDQLSEKAPDRVLALARKLSVRESSSYTVYYNVFRSWVKRDPAQAAKEAAALDDRTLRTGALDGVAQTWAGVDPAASLRWIQGLGDDNLVERLMQKYADGLSAKDAKAAVESVGSRPLTERDQALFQSMLLSWADKEPALAAEWVNQASKLSDQEKSTFTTRIVSLESYHKPALAVELIGRYPDRIDGDIQLLRRVGPYLLRAKGTAGLQVWAEKLPENLSYDFWREMVPIWAAENGKELSDWVEKLPAGDLRTTVLGRWAIYRRQRDLPDAIAWANALPNEEGNREAILLVAERAFALGKGGVKIAARVLPPDRLAEEVEGWCSEMMDGMPDAIRQFVEETDVLKPEVRARLLERLDTIKKKK